MKVKFELEWYEYEDGTASGPLEMKELGAGPVVLHVLILSCLAGRMNGASSARFGASYATAQLYSRP